MIRTSLIALLAGALIAQAATTEDEIRQVEKNWAVTVTSPDHTALERMLGDQLIYAHSTGAVESRSEYMARLRNGAQKYDRIQHHSIAVRTYGDTAVAHSKVRMLGTSNGTPFDDELMMLHLWVKQAGKWQLAAHQTTKLR